jgi:hypothetical protein
MATKLSKAVRDFAADIDGIADAGERGLLPEDIRNCSELARVLARIVEGKSIAAAFGAPGDWGYGTPIGDGILAMLKEPAPDESGIEWHYVADELPDDETRVMIAIDEEDTEEPEYGYLENGRWWYDDEPHLSPVEAKVYAWAHAPGVPPKKGGAS